jgi:hypothetical protein
VIWTGTAWVVTLAPACSGCGQIMWLDRLGRCSDCALYDELGLFLIEVPREEGRDRQDVDADS